MAYQTVICLGDSIANGYWDDRGLGWFGRLQEMLAAAKPKGFGFNNLAMSGDRTIDVYHRLCAEALSREPDILIIAVGCNDITRWQREDGPTDQSPQTRHEIWHRVLQTASHNVEKVLVVGLLPSVENRYPTKGYDGITPMWQKSADARTYNAEIASWCAEYQVPFLDVLENWLQEDIEPLFEDGSHPTGHGHAKLAAQVLEKMQNLGWVA